MSAAEKGPLEREFGLEGLGVRVGLCTLADGGHRIVHQRPAANVKFGGRTQSIGEGIAAVHAGNSEGVVFANDIVRALLAVCRQVAIAGGRRF